MMMIHSFLDGLCMVCLDDVFDDGCRHPSPVHTIQVTRTAHVYQVHYLFCTVILFPILTMRLFFYITHRRKNP